MSSEKSCGSSFPAAASSDASSVNLGLTYSRVVFALIFDTSKRTEYVIAQTRNDRLGRGTSNQHGVGKAGRRHLRLPDADV